MRLPPGTPAAIVMLLGPVAWALILWALWPVLT